MTVDGDRKLNSADITLGDLRVADFPTACEWDPFRVHISTEAYRAVITHARESDQVELCGVLVGELLKDDRGPYLSITHTIRGENAEHHAAQVTFTQDTWAHIYSVMDSAHTDRVIVGWYHTHPGFGVFLSEMDLFIHHNFFNLPWQVALVVDPRAGDEGFFVWRNGEPALTTTHWVGDEVKIQLPGVSGGNVNTALQELRANVAGFRQEMRRAQRRLRRVRVGLWFQLTLLLAAVAWIKAGSDLYDRAKSVISVLRTLLNLILE